MTDKYPLMTLVSKSKKEWKGKQLKRIHIRSVIN